MLVNSFRAHTSIIYRIKQSLFNNNNDLVATCSGDKTVKIWNISNISNWTLLRTYKDHNTTVYSLEWINADTIASGSYDQTIRIWSISTGQTNIIINASSIVFSLKLLNNGFYLASALSNGKIKINNVNDNGNLISTLDGHTSNVRDLSLISDDLLASSSGYPDQTIRIWNLTTNSAKFNLTGHANSVYGLRLMSSDILASGSADNSTKLWNITSGSLIRTLKNHTNYIYWSVDLINNYDNSQSVLVSGSMDQTIKIWNYATGDLLNTVKTTVQIQTLTVLNPSIVETVSSQTGKEFLARLNLTNLNSPFEG